LHCFLFSHVTSIRTVVLFVSFPSFIIYHFLLPLLSPFSCFLLFHIGSFSVLLVLLRHFSSRPSLPWFSIERQHPTSQLQCYWNVHCSHLLPLLGFPCPCVHIIMFFGLPGLHSVFVPWSSPGLRLSPSYRFVYDYLFINQILHLPIFSFFSLCTCERSPVYLAITPVRTSSITQRLSPQLHYHPPPAAPLLASTLLAGTTLLRLFTALTRPYINAILGQQAFFWILDHWRWDR
jgi:hypothetical protein